MKLKPNVQILATVRNPALLEATLLVFKTIRAGFPTATINVQGNKLEHFAETEVRQACEKVGASFANLSPTTHDRWIEEEIQSRVEPFWICDTDVVFFGQVEDWFDNEGAIAMAGRLEPQFYEEWTNTRHVERLHTALMWLNAPMLRQVVRSWMGGIPSLWHSAQMNLVRQQFIPCRDDLVTFYDSCAGLWHAIGGCPFTAEQDAAFEHLHCGTYSDLMRAPGLKDLAQVHKQIFAKPELARGMKREQDKYYESRRKKQQRPGTVGGSHAV